MIDIEERRRDVYRNGSDGVWVLQFFEGDDALHLESVDISIAASELYADIDLSAA